MEKILEKYGFCNRFSLSGHRGFYRLSNEEADEIIKITKKRNREECKKVWEIINVENDSLLFEQVIRDIETEILDFGEGYIADTVGEGTKYGIEFWFIYSLLSEELNQIKLVEKLKAITDDEIPLIETDDKYEVLKKNMLYKEISFHTHCTISSILFETYYFELNDETKKWLLNYKNVFSFDGELLEDLAFYNDDKLEFSSCTHEGYTTEKKEEE